MVSIFLSFGNKLKCEQTINEFDSVINHLLCLGNFMNCVNIE